MVSSSFLPHLLPPPQLGDCSRAWREWVVVGWRGRQRALTQRCFLSREGLPVFWVLPRFKLSLSPLPLPPPPCHGCSGGCPAPPPIPRMRLGAPQLLVSVGEVGNGARAMPSRDTHSLSGSLILSPPRHEANSFGSLRVYSSPSFGDKAPHLLCFQMGPSVPFTQGPAHHMHVQRCPPEPVCRDGVPGGQSPWAIGRYLLSRAPSRGSIRAWWRWA